MIEQIKDFMPVIIECVIIPLICWLSNYGISFIKMKTEEIKAKTNNELANKYLTMLDTTVETCVVKTNQTFVDGLKKAGTFDADAQKEAFKLTYESILNILSEEAQTYLAEAFGDLQTLLTNKIEQTVNKNK